jgi:predicted RNA binding protein YcfA (HicA-like mRNA interferase family)
MPGGRKLRDISGDQAIRAFQRAGYRVVRTRGSHVILEHDLRKPLVIPRHRRLRTGMIMARIKDAGLTVEEFEELL